MLKETILSMSLLASFNVLADCEINESLLGKKCSDEYVKVRNKRELKDYLENGKFKNGKLLNLEIDFPYSSDNVDINSPCDIKFKSEIVSRKYGLCIKGRNIFIEKTKIVVMEKELLKITAQDSIQIKKGKLYSNGEINVSTLNYDPFDGQVLISKDSNLRAEKINLTSKSNLILHKNSQVHSKDLVLNGGNCDLDESDDGEVRKEKDCRHFSYSLKYRGSCKENIMSEKFKISLSESKASKSTFKFDVLNLKGNEKVLWRFDNNTPFYGRSGSLDSFIPGKHFAEVIIQGEKGFFRKIASTFNAGITDLVNDQVVVFNFFDEGENSRLVAFVDSTPVPLVKVGEGMHGYYVQGLKEGKHTISIPRFNYREIANVVSLPRIKNLDYYLNEYINTEIAKVTLGLGSYRGGVVKDAAIISYENIRKKVLALPEKEKEKLASFLRANSKVLPRVVSSSSFEGNVTDLFISQAYAGIFESLDSLSSKKLAKYVLNQSVYMYLAPAAIAISGSYAAIAACSNPLCRVGVAIATLGATFAVLTYSVEAAELIGDSHIPQKGTLSGILPEQVSSGVSFSVRLKGRYVPVDATGSKEAETVFNSILKNKNENYTISLINEKINSINSILEGLVDPIEIIKEIEFPQTIVTSSLDSKYVTSAKIIRSEDDKAFLRPFSRNGDSVNLVIDTERSQSVTVEIFYDNLDLGVAQSIIVELYVVSSFEASIKYLANNSSITFDATVATNPTSGLTYTWDFGDGEFFEANNPIVLHKYKPGTYSITLTVSNSDGKSKTAEVEIEIAPEANFTFSKKSSFRFSFDATNPRNANVNNVKYVWDFGDGKMLETSQPIVEHRYVNVGVYDVMLTTVSESGKSSSHVERIDIATPQFSFFLKLNTRATYLRTDNRDLDYGDPNNLPYGIPFPAQFVDLAPLFTNSDVNLQPGDFIYLKATGDYRFGHNPEIGRMLLGVFSDGSKFYYPGPESDFMPVITPPTIKYNLATDIPQDFEIFHDEETVMQIPSGANRILFAINSGSPGWTDDTDQDFGVWITVKVVRSQSQSATLSRKLD